MARREKFSINELTVGLVNGYSFPGDMGVGNIYYVCLSGYTAPYNFLRSKYSGKTYSDGSKILHTTIASAVTATVSGRNDYIIVSPGPWGVTAAIDLSAKECVHLIGAGGLTQDVGSSGPAYIVGAGSAHTIILGNWCEVAGLQIWNASGYNAIYASLKQGIHIHHNFIRMTAAAGIVSGVYLAGAYGNNYNRVSYNKLHHYAGTAGGYGILSDNGTGNDIVGNEVIVFGGCTYDYGIFNNSHGGQTDFNRVSDCGGGGTITVGIQTRTTNASSCMGNLVGLPTGTALAGGTTNRSFVQNFDAQAGGAAAIES